MIKECFFTWLMVTWTIGSIRSESKWLIYMLTNIVGDTWLWARRAGRVYIWFSIKCLFGCGQISLTLVLASTSTCHYRFICRVWTEHKPSPVVDFFFFFFFYLKTKPLWLQKSFSSFTKFVILQQNKTWSCRRLDWRSESESGSNGYSYDKNTPFCCVSLQVRDKRKPSN